jgi:transitional endoplasmic reticulum ATPase
MAAPELFLKVVLHRSPLDARRGIVRVHSSVLDVLGVRPWDPLGLTGTRRTAALAAAVPPGSGGGEIFMDDLTCANAGVAPGAMVQATPVEVRAGAAVELTGLPSRDHPQPATVRLALLGKVLTQGDRVGLLPQDFSRPPEGGGDLRRLISSLQDAYGRSWQELAATVAVTSPPGPVRVTMDTRIHLGETAETTGSSTPTAPVAASPGTSEHPGLEPQFARLRELFDLSFNHTELLGRLGAAPQLGVLVTGPPGSGKGALVEGVAAATGARLTRVWAPALARLEPGAAASRLRTLVSQAQAAPPSVVMIEDVEVIAARDEPGPLLDLLRELVSGAVRAEGVAIVCTTAHPEVTSPTLRLPGVLDHEVEIPLPSRDDRLRMLAVQTRSLPLAPDVDLAEVSARTPGFVAADLGALCREASLRAAQRLTSEPNGAPFVAAADFDAALDVVKPSSLDGIHVEVAEVRLDEVGDMDDVKKELTEAVIWPLRYPDTFERLGVEPGKGVLLFGPPGCGKTFLVRALITESEANFLAVKGAELLTKWVGESERSVRELFRRARSAAPSIVLFDEIDALAPTRGASHDSSTTDRVVAQLLTELDGVEQLRDVFVVGATNRPDLVDPALLRPGRLERLVYVPPPDEVARGAILTAVAQRMPLEEGLDLAGIAAACEAFSAADIAALARQAALTAMRENIEAPAITAEHFAAARRTIKSSLRPETVNALERWAARRST